MDGKIDLNVDVIHGISNLCKVGTDPGTHFIGKNLDRKLVVKITKEHKLTKGKRAYDYSDI